MENFTILKNDRFNSLEISFSEKPSETVRNILKGFGFRWNPKKSIWYGFADLDEVKTALESENTAEPAPVAVSKVKSCIPSLWERLTAEIPNHEKHQSTKEIAKQTREHFKKTFPEIKISCTIGNGGWSACNEIHFKIVSAPFSKDSAIFEYLEKYINAWLWSFNYDNSDSMTDYFDRGFYENISSRDFVETMPTGEQKTDFENFYTCKAAFDKAEEEREEEAFMLYLEEQKQKEIEYKKAEEIRKKKETSDRALIAENVKIIELSETEKYIIDGAMFCGAGKENSIAEILEDVQDSRTETALIKKELHFSNKEAFEAFSDMFLYDFEFLAGCGGTGTFDNRVDDENFSRLNQKQREAIKWVLWDCVAVYLGEELKYIIDPEGFSYSRYVNIINGTYTKTPIKTAEEAEKEEKTAFYFPAPIAEQSEALNEGEAVSIISLDPWSMTATMKHGKISHKIIADYAQHKNSLWFDFLEDGKRKATGEHHTDNGNVLIYPGTIPPVPENLLKEKITNNQYFLRNCGATAHDFMIDCVKYYDSIGIKPIINTLQY